MLDFAFYLEYKEVVPSKVSYGTFNTENGSIFTAKKEERVKIDIYMNYRLT